ncbi:MAG: hypothetical protein R3F46_01300 [bacterium]
MRITHIYMYAGLLSAALLISCGGGNGAQLPQPGGSGRAFSMHVMPESFALQGRAEFEFSIAETAESALLSISLADASQLSHAYLEIGYDPQQWTPVAAHSAGLLGEAALSLLAADGRGRAQYGELLPGSDPQGISGSGKLATIEFRRGADSPRQAAAITDPAPQPQRNANWDIISWYYENTGDYDQNGEVNIADLTPLGVNLGRQVPDDEGSALAMVDGDGNGLISLADITPIGQNFGNSLAAFRLYAAEDGSGPERLVRSLSLADAGLASGGRRRFQLTDTDVRLHDRYWLVAEFNAGNSAPSAMTAEWQKNWRRTVIHSQAEQPTGTPPDIAMVGGRPCVVFTTGQFQNGITLFSRATDRIGDGWSTPVNITGIHDLASTPLIVDRNGAAAVAWYSLSSYASYYRHALDAEGSTWSDPLAVIGGEFELRELHMFQGKAMLTCSDGDQAAAFIISEQGELAIGHSLGPGADLATIPRSGGLDVLYRSSTGNNTVYSEMEYTGSTFEFVSPSVITGDLNLDATPALFEFGGRLHMLLQDDLLFQHSLVQGPAGGNVFTAPGPFLDNPIDGIQVAESLGRLWLSNVHYTENQIQCHYSAEDSLEQMQPTVPVDPDSSFVLRPAIADVSGHPAVLYFDDNDGGPFELVFARYI